MRKENELIEQKELREQMIDRVEVLDRVGELILLPNTEYATTEQVAKYFGVAIETIKSTINYNYEELKKQWLYCLYKGKSFKFEFQS